jgi:hypothetical protein
MNKPISRQALWERKKRRERGLKASGAPQKVYIIDGRPWTIVEYATVKGLAYATARNHLIRLAEGLPLPYANKEPKQS